MHYRSPFKLNDEESLSRFGDWCFNQARLLVCSGEYNYLSFGLLKNPLVPNKRTSVDVEPCDVRLDCFIRLDPIFTTPLLVVLRQWSGTSILPSFFVHLIHNK